MVAKPQQITIIDHMSARFAEMDSTESIDLFELISNRQAHFNP